MQHSIADMQRPPQVRVLSLSLKLVGNGGREHLARIAKIVSSFSSSVHLPKHANRKDNAIATKSVRKTGGQVSRELCSNLFIILGQV